MATFYKKISSEEIAAIRRVMRDCLEQTRAASCHNVVRELDTILIDVEDRPNLAEPDGGNNARVDENKKFCEQKWDDNLSEPLSKLFTPNRAGKLEGISNWSAWWGTINDTLFLFRRWSRATPPRLCSQPDRSPGLPFLGIGAIIPKPKS